MYLRTRIKRLCPNRSAELRIRHLGADTQNSAANCPANEAGVGALVEYATVFTRNYHN